MHRFLDPVQLGLGQHRQHAPRSGEIPALIRVGHHGDVGSDRPPHGPHPGRVLAPIGRADLDLHPSPAAVDQRTEITNHLRDTEIEPATIGVVRLDRIGRATEQAPQRRSGTLRGEIPQRDIDHRQGHVDNPGPADPVRRQPIEPLPGAEDVLRRSSDHSGRVVLVDHVTQQLRSAVDSGDPGPDPAVGRPDLHHRDDPGLQCRGRVRQHLHQRYGERVRLDRDDDVALVARCEVGLRGRQQAQRVVRHLELHSTAPCLRSDSVRPFSHADRTGDNAEVRMQRFRTTNTDGPIASRSGW